MEHHPVVRYSTSELGKMDRLVLDNVVLDRWDRFMQEGNFRYRTFRQFAASILNFVCHVVLLSFRCL